jgi:ABC-type branched-subunit amino acid transport system ATPase component
MSALLEAEDITFSYGSVQVLFGVTLRVEPGESLALVGTNGAGKSTLLRVIAGLEQPSTGRIIFQGRDVTQMPAERLASRGLVLVEGGRSIFADLSVRENLDIQGMTMRRNKSRLRQRRQVVLETFPALREAWSRPAGTLSGGQQQQLALAKSMLLEPDVLCIDELSLGLAPVVVDALIEVVRQIQRDGVTVVLVEQSLHIAGALCPRAIFMEKGAIRFEGFVTDLLERDDIARAVFFGETGGARTLSTPLSP